MVLYLIPKFRILGALGVPSCFFLIHNVGIRHRGYFTRVDFVLGVVQLELQNHLILHIHKLST
jgi:hypothetical protein